MERYSEPPPFDVIESRRVMSTLGSTVAQESVIALGDRVLNAFVKSGVTPMAIEKIRNQAMSHELINAIGERGKPSFRAPDVYGLNQEGSLATEWIDTEPLSETDDLEHTAVVLGGIMAVFDKYAERSISLPQFGLREAHPEYVTALQVRVVEQLSLGHINRDEAELFYKSIQYLNKTYGSLGSIAQHGDLRPDHIFPDPTGQRAYVIIDSELMRGIWPRFYDLGKSLARYAITHPNPDLGPAILREFLDASGASPETVLGPLRTILIARGLTFSLFPIHDLRPVSRRMSADFRKRALVLLEHLPAVNSIEHLTSLLTRR